MVLFVRRGDRPNDQVLMSARAPGGVSQDCDIAPDTGKKIDNTPLRLLISSQSIPLDSSQKPCDVVAAERGAGTNHLVQGCE
jgi:hypothetical protein